MARGPTKTELETTNARLDAENQALNAFAAEFTNGTLKEPIAVVKTEYGGIRVHYIPRIYSGGYVVLIETFDDLGTKAKQLPHVTGLTLHGEKNSFTAFCDWRAQLHEYRWRDVEAKIFAAHNKLIQDDLDSKKNR